MQTFLVRFRLYLWLFIPALLVASLGGNLLGNNGAENLHAWQAKAFLSGHLDLQNIPAAVPGEVLEVNGKTYMPFPPFPALLLTPFVALFGVESLKVTLITAALACLSCYFLFKILQNLEIDPGSITWVLAAFFLGTAYWFVLRGGQSVWMFAQVVCVCFMLLSIHEAFGKGRGLLAGLLLGCAFMSRQLALYAGIFLLARLWDSQAGRKRTLNLLGFLIGLGICILVYAGFNYLRFGGFGTGYGQINVEGIGKARMEEFGLFSPVYMFFNFIYMFLQGFHLEFGGVDGLQLVGMDPFGTSLLAASPFIIAAFRASGSRRLILAAWLSCILALFHMLLYFNNGFIQLNSQRFTLDFLPVLTILIALGLKNASRDLAVVLKSMFIYSVLLNTLTFILAG